MKTVLIADDIPFAQQALKELLEKNGFQVVALARSGAEAIEAYEKYKPDFVTMDLAMPGMNGVQATKRIVQNDPNARVIILTSMDQEELASDAIRAGAREFVLKPFHAAELLQAIRSVFMERDAAPDLRALTG